MEKKLYTCPYCKGEHETPGSLARCILSCEEKIKKEKEEERKAKLAAERESRFKEVMDAYKHADALRDAVIEDYGYFTYETEDGMLSLWDVLFKR